MGSINHACGNASPKPPEVLRSAPRFGGERCSSPLSEFRNLLESLGTKGIGLKEDTSRPVRVRDEKQKEVPVIHDPLTHFAFGNAFGQGNGIEAILGNTIQTLGSEKGLVPSDFHSQGSMMAIEMLSVMRASIGVSPLRSGSQAGKGYLGAAANLSSIASAVMAKALAGLQTSQHEFTA